jgi:Domain of unknown function (DUF4279)
MAVRSREVKVRQYAYLSVLSESLDPGQLSEELALMPTDAKLRGSRQPGPPPIPRCHLWQLGSGVKSHEVRLDQHLSSLLSRLAGSAARIRKLAESGDATAVIQVVRYFEPGPEDRHIIEPGRNVGGLERLGGQHPLVGFDLEPALVSFAAEAGVGFSFDEYGDEDD